MPWRQLACLLEGQEMEHPAHFAVRGVEQEFPPPHANGFHPPSITQVGRLPLQLQTDMIPGIVVCQLPSQERLPQTLGTCSGHLNRWRARR